MGSSEIFLQWEKKLPRTKLVERDAFVLDLCRGRRVAHLGACDSPMSREKASSGELLHQKLQGVCTTLTGFDNDRAAIEMLAQEFGLHDIVCRDLVASRDGDQEVFDVVVCADIIEHVNCAGNLIECCSELLGAKGELIVTTINALSGKQSMRALLGREPVHPEHVAYYSYATLGSLLGRFGFEITSCRFFSYGTVSRLAGMLFSLLYAVAPQTADGIVVVARRTTDG